MSSPDSSSMDWGYADPKKRDEKFTHLVNAVKANPPPLPVMIQKFESMCGAQYGNMIGIIWGRMGYDEDGKHQIDQMMDDYLCSLRDLKMDGDHSGWQELEWANDVMPISLPEAVAPDSNKYASSLRRLAPHLQALAGRKQR